VAVLVRKEKRDSWLTHRIEGEGCCHVTFPLCDTNVCEQADRADENAT
jgi:hypothetical protein